MIEAVLPLANAGEKERHDLVNAEHLIASLNHFWRSA